METCNFFAIFVSDIATVLQKPLPELGHGLPYVLLSTFATLQHVDNIRSVTVEETIDLDRVVIAG